MNKMKKLLSVVLAVVLALSAFSMMGSAAKTAYKTVDELTALQAYSPYGQVTRLSIEERTSIVFDALDNLLPTLNINMGEVFNVLGLSVTIDLTSVDRLCYSFDTIKDTFENGLASLAMAIVDLGILESLETGKWTTGMSRDGTANYTILSTLLAFLSDNTTLVNNLFTQGLDLGLVSLGDMSAIENIIMNLPGLVKGLVYPLIERWDDTLADIQTYDNSIADENVSIEDIANTRVKALFDDDMSITTLKYDVNGNMTSEHTTWKKATGSADPGTPSATSPRCYYQFSSTTPGSVMTVWHIVDAKEAEELAKDNDDENNVAAYNYFKEEQTFVMTEEVEGSGTYVWRATDEWGNTWSLKWYNDESPLLEGIDGSAIELNDADTSAADILYKFMPVVFEEMAPVVLNGSVKKLLAEFVGVKFTYVGQGGPEADDAVKALPDSSDAFFTQEQGEYLWEWSDYKVINGNHYYRFEDQIFAGDISKANNYFDIINWDYKVEANLFNKYVPTSDDVNTRLLQNTADFLTDVANLVLLPSAETEDNGTGDTATWTRPTFEAGNANLVKNVKALAQAVVGLAPQHIFGDDYATNERCYVELMLSSDNDTVLTGIAAHLVNMLMPSMSLPGKSDILASGAKVGAILAAVVREFAAYLAPEYNFDALIYEENSFENGAKKFVKPAEAGLVTTGDTEADYWFDVILTMGINVGYEYLRAFSDMGEDTEYCNGVVNAPVNYMATGGTYAAGTTQATLNAQWEGMLDYIIDWALDSTQEWTWAMSNLVDAGVSCDLKTAEDPFVKLQNILGAILPVDEILTVTPDEGQTKIEHWLRDDLILGIVNLKWDHLIDTLQFNGPNQYFRDGYILDELATLLKGIINPIFAKVGGGSYKLIPDAITDFDSLAKQANLVTMVKSLVGVLYTAGVTQGGCRTLFPFLNFLLGWKTDPQVIKDPVMWTEFRDNNDYAFQYNIAAGGAIDSETTKIKILNNSSGMLETHRNSSVTDHAYDINIRNITSDATLNTLTFTYDNVVSPYEQVDIAIGGTYNKDEAVTVTIEYDYVGKDGKAVGGTQYTSITFLVSNLYEDSNLSTCQANDHDDDYTGLTDVKGYVFTEDIVKTALEYEAEIHYVSASFSNPSKSFVSCQPEGKTTDCNGNVTNAGKVPTGQAAQYFAQYEGQAGGWTNTLSKDGTSSTRAKLYYAINGTTEDMEDSMPYGAYDMGELGVKYGSDTKVIIVDFIHYNDFNVYDIYTENKDNGYNANQGVDAATYEAYRTAWNKIVYLATYPMMTTSRSTANWEGVTAQGTAANDYVTVIQPQIEQAITDYEAAKEAYETALADAQSAGGSAAALPTYVQALRTEIEDDFMNGKEINFQDYDFYEYFNYNDTKVAAENLYRTFLAPKVLDQYYILNSGISEAELDLVMKNEDNSIIADGIKASRLENNAEAVSASKAAKDEWKMPTTSKLIVEDMTSRLAYYKQFLSEANMENTLSENPDHLVFLNREIAFVEAQNLVEADYTEASWANYAEALAEAKAVASGSDEYAKFNSRVYDVKYNLMVAYKNLLLKEFSLIEAGGTADLQANINIANEIFASLEAGDGEWALSEDYEGTEAAAYAQLISALGYNYQAVYSVNDQEVQDGIVEAGTLKTNADGTPMVFNLYADSALEYAENDRPNNQNNRAKVATSNAALEAAIANFESAAKDPNTLMIKADYADSGIVIDKLFVSVMSSDDWYPEFAEAEDAGATGLVYGFDTLCYMSNEDELTLADVLTTAYGDDYLQITTMEGSDGWESTGTIIEVLDEDGAVVETYYFVYFGDLNGDTVVDGTDVTASIRWNSYSENVETLAQLAAADMNADAFADGADVTLMIRANSYEEYAVQEEISADFYACVEEYAAELGLV